MWYIFEIYTNTHVGGAGKGMAIYMCMKESVEIGHPNICENMYAPKREVGRYCVDIKICIIIFISFSKLRGKFHFKNHLRD
jgi:hypothetical protein